MLVCLVRLCLTLCALLGSAGYFVMGGTQVTTFRTYAGRLTNRRHRSKCAACISLLLKDVLLLHLAHHSVSLLFLFLVCVWGGAQ